MYNLVFEHPGSSVPFIHLDNLVSRNRINFTKGRKDICEMGSCLDVVEINRLLGLGQL